MSLLVKRINSSATIPSRQSAQAAGYDLSAAEPCVIPAYGKGIVKTGLSMTCPDGTYGRVAPRSGLSWKHQIDVGAGVIDQDFTGEIGVVLFNHGGKDLVVNIGDRVAQLVLDRIVTTEVVEVDTLEETERGEGGFGSTDQK